MKRWMILGISVVLALFFAINPVFADSVDTSKQITISKDLVMRRFVH